MKISHNDNVLYKDRTNHRTVTIGKPSLQNGYENNNYKTPLERTSREISFKGVPFAQLFKNLIQKESNALPLEKALQILEKNIGKNARTLQKTIGVDHAAKAKQRIIYKYKNGVEHISFVEQGLLKQTWNGIKYPFTALPQEIYYGTVNFLHKHHIMSDKKFQHIEKNSIVYKYVKDNVKFEEKFNALKGQIEKAIQCADDPEHIQAARLKSAAAKMYDPKTGNYNTVHERALNRIVSGSIPAVFLANDAFNLSSLIDNNPKNAQKEHDLRFNQEVKRVGSNAYVQLITLGALAKFTNSSKMSVLFTTWLTFLATEAYSRLSNGKPINFISPEQAKRINENNSQKDNKEVAAEAKKNIAESKITKKQPQTFKGNLDFMKTPEAFKKVILPNMDAVKVSSYADKPAVTGSKDNNNEKPLLNAKTLFSAAAILLATGYALKFSRKKFPKFENIFINANKWWKTNYNKLTIKEHSISSQSFGEIVKELQNGGYKPMADYYRLVAKNFQKASAINLLNKDQKFLERMTKAGQTELLEKLKGFKKDNIINKNVSEFFKHLEEKGLKDCVQECKKALSKYDNKLTDSSYNKVIKIIKKASEKEAKLFDNVFIVDEANELCKHYDGIINSLGKNSPLAKEVQEEVYKIIQKQSNIVKLGEVPNKFKTTIDFVIAPFKFIVDTLKFPYNVAETFRKLGMKNMPKFDNEIKVLSDSMQKLPKDLKSGNQEFIKNFEKNIQKSFNKISMSGVSNSELSNIVRFSAVMGTGWFLVADNYNMVMLKSNGNNVEEAKTKRNERIVQEASRFFYTSMFISWFNNTFSKVYHRSLIGMSIVTAACTVVGEYFTRASIGIPTKKSTQKEIIDEDYKNINDKGARGHFFRFMSRLTGKKALSERNSK